MNRRRRSGPCRPSGFSEGEVDELLASFHADLGLESGTDPGPEEPPENPDTRLGDLWILGGHRRA